MRLLLLATCLALADSQGTTPDGCFRSFANVGVRCATPFERRSAVSDQQCRDLCSQMRPRCQAIQFNVGAGRCDLFNVPLEPSQAQLRQFKASSGVVILENGAFIPDDPSFRLRQLDRRRRFRRASGYASRENPAPGRFPHQTFLEPSAAYEIFHNRSSGRYDYRIRQRDAPLIVFDKPRFSQADPGAYGYGEPTYQYEKTGYGYEEPSHGYEKPKYSYEEPKYGYEKPSYGYEEPKHGYEKPSHEYEKPSYGYEPPKPHYGYDEQKPEPSYEEPSYGAVHKEPSYGYEAPEPQYGYEAPKPSYGYEAPKPPGYGKPEPPEPSYGYAQPQPTYGYQPAPQPSYGYQPAPQPSYPPPQPSYPAPQPSYPAPQPSYPAPQPSYPAPQPSYPAPQPSYPAPQPSYPAPQPSYPAPQPSYPAPQPSYPAPQPSYPAPQPSYGYEKPKGYGQEESKGYGHEEPEGYGHSKHGGGYGGYEEKGDDDGDEHLDLDYHDYDNGEDDGKGKKGKGDDEEVYEYEPFHPKTYKVKEVKVKYLQPRITFEHGVVKAAYRKEHGFEVEPVYGYVQKSYGYGGKKYKQKKKIGYKKKGEKKEEEPAKKKVNPVITGAGGILAQPQPAQQPLTAPAASGVKDKMEDMTEIPAALANSSHHHHRRRRYHQAQFQQGQYVIGTPTGLAPPPAAISYQQGSSYGNRVGVPAPATNYRPAPAPATTYNRGNPVPATNYRPAPAPTTNYGGGNAVAATNYNRGNVVPATNLYGRAVPATNNYRPAPAPAANVYGQGSQPRTQNYKRTCYGAQVTQSVGSNYYRPTGVCDGNRPATQGPFNPATTPRPVVRTTTEPLPEEVVCPPGTAPRFLETAGVILEPTNALPSVTLQARDQEECLQACADNRLPSGRSAPCLSLNYDAISGECRLTTDAFPPLGVGLPFNPADLSPPRPDMSYFEKTCVNAQDAESCPGPYLRFPQRILIGYATQVFTANSIDECLDLCLRSEGMEGETCNSAMFYFDETEFNCILNAETKDSVDEDLFAPEDLESVDYYELNCAFQRRASVKRSRGRLAVRRSGELRAADAMLPPNDAWGPWSACQDNRRVRFKDCGVGARNPKSCIRQEGRCGGRPSLLAAYRRRVQRAGHRRRNRDFLPTTKGPKGAGSEECNNFVSCCAVLRTDGSKDCKIGFRYELRPGAADPARRQCKPSNC